MVRDHSPAAGTSQRRYRTRLAKQGWRGICTYLTVEHRIALKQIQREQKLTTLHEALALVLNNSTMLPFDGTPPPSVRNLPCLTVE
ncbi:MAG: hypothetical protein AB7I59_01780 [Geminicoccaceae bacterium]